MDEVAWTVFGILALSGMVWLFFRFTREGQWLGWFARTVRHYLRSGEWDDL